MSDLVVERVGGIAGFGLPNSRLKSRGRCALSSLSDADRQIVEQLFARPPSGKSFPDVFRYRITQTSTQGDRVVEVPESHVPPALAACVRDELE
jgi:hypothetical protein